MKIEIVNKKRLVSFILLFIGIVFIFIMQILIHNRSQAILEDWPITEGIVVLSYIQEVDRPRKLHAEYIPVMYYQYVINAEVYSQRCGSYGDTWEIRYYRDPQDARNELQKLGSSQIIYYKPGYPMQCFSDVSVITDGEHIFLLSGVCSKFCVTSLS